jgi:transposase
MRLPPLVVTDEDRVVLESLTRSRTAATRDVQRARIVLLAADGWSNRAISDEVGLHYNQVAVWRDRYRDEGLAGLVDTDRPGRPPVYDADDVILLVKTATETPPAPASRWTMEALARRLNPDPPMIMGEGCAGA